MRTRAVHVSKVLTLAFLILAVCMEAARLSNAASENAKHVPLKKVPDIPLPGPACLLYTSPSPRDLSTSRMPSSA